MEWLDFDIRLHGSWLYLLILPAAVAFTLLVYRRTLPQVSPGARAVLTVLRSLSAVLLLLLLIEPVLNLLFKRAVPPTIITLLDTSGSMAVADTLSRLGQARRILESPAFKELESTSQLETWGFADEPFRLDLDTLDRVFARGRATDLSAALTRAVAATAAPEPGAAAVMLLSDGAHNYGADPLRIAAELEVPVFAVGLAEGGDGFADIQLTQTELEGARIAGRPLAVRVELRSWGFAGRTTTVRLLEGESELALQPLTLKGAGEAQRLSLELVADEPGPHIYRVEVAALDGEVSDDNNQSLLAAHIERGRISVQVVAGAPGAEYAFLRRALASDSTFVLEEFIQRRQGAFYRKKATAFLESLESRPEVIILVDVGTDLLSGEFGAAVAASVRRGSGLLFIGGPRSLDAWNPDAALAAVLPFRAGAGSRLTADRITLKRATTGLDHPLMRPHPQMRPHLQMRAHSPAAAAGASGREVDDPWTRLPPLTGHLPGLALRAGATGLLDGRGAAGTGPVVMLNGGASAGKAIAALSSGFWRLDLLSSGAGESPQTIRRFWRNAVRWLAIEEPGGLVRASTGRRVYRGGEPVEFLVQVFDELTKPLTGSVVSIELEGGGDRIILEPEDPGVYRGSWSGLDPGDHTFSAEARTADGARLGTSSGRFVIQEYSLESSDMRANPQLLARLARATGGAFSGVDAWRSLLRDMDTPTRLQQEQRTVHLWGHHWYLLLLVALLCAEWGLRKRRGML